MSSCCECLQFLVKIHTMSIIPSSAIVLLNGIVRVLVEMRETVAVRNVGLPRLDQLPGLNIKAPFQENTGSIGANMDCGPDLILQVRSLIDLVGHTVRTSC